MTTNRTTGMVTQAAQPARSQPSASVLHLYPEFLKSLPFGLVLLHLENPRDVKTYRIIDLNPAAGNHWVYSGKPSRQDTRRFPQAFGEDIPCRVFQTLLFGGSKRLGRSLIR